MGKRINNPNYFKLYNILMTGLLIFVAMSIAYEHVYIPLMNLN
ncbi:hypothetical protein FM109_09690 [Vibrio casei]|nr:hypothetical protein FM109_09690 [Vibrio casei]